jgi:hypothetical protein
MREEGVAPKTAELNPSEWVVFADDCMSIHCENGRAYVQVLDTKIFMNPNVAGGTLALAA